MIAFFKKDYDCALMAPAWGMIGTLIGLVQMLQTLSDPASIGPSMAVALLTTIAYREAKGAYPSGHEVNQPKDAWGNQIYYEFFHDKKGYDFLIFSHGPDGKKGTSDDMIMVHAKDENDTGANKIPSSGQDSLDQLEGLADAQKSKSSGEPTVSLEQLSEMAKNKGSNSRELELSLDDLKKLSGNN